MEWCHLPFSLFLRFHGHWGGQACPAMHVAPNSLLPHYEQLKPVHELNNNQRLNLVITHHAPHLCSSFIQSLIILGGVNQSFYANSFMLILWFTWAVFTYVGKLFLDIWIARAHTHTHKLNGTLELCVSRFLSMWSLVLPLIYRAKRWHLHATLWSRLRFGPILASFASREIVGVKRVFYFLLRVLITHSFCFHSLFPFRRRAFCLD